MGVGDPEAEPEAEHRSEERGDEPPPAGPLVLGPDPALGGHHDHGAPANLEPAHRRIEEVQVVVVDVEVDHHVTPCRQQPGPQGGAVIGGGERQSPHLVELRFEFPGQHRGAIGGAILDHDDLGPVTPPA